MTYPPQDPYGQQGQYPQQNPYGQPGPYQPYPQQQAPQPGQFHQPTPYPQQQYTAPAVIDDGGRSRKRPIGVVLMIGGNIPGETQVLSIALYDQVETLRFAEAHRLAAGLLLFSLGTLFLVYRYSGNGWRVRA